MKFTHLIVLLSFLVTTHAHAVHVAGCNVVGTYCDIHPNGGYNETIFAVKNEVAEASETDQWFKNISKLSSSNFTDQVENIRKIENTIINGTKEFDGIQGVEAKINPVFVKIENLRKEYKKAFRRTLAEKSQTLLHEQICEHIIIPPNGSVNRSKVIEEKFECLRGSFVGFWYGSVPFSYGQLHQMYLSLRKLYKLTGENSSSQRHRISDAQDEFHMFSKSSSRERR